MSHHGSDLYHGDYRELEKLVGSRLRALEANNTSNESDARFYRHLQDVEFTLRTSDGLLPYFQIRSNHAAYYPVPLTVQQYSNCFKAVKEHTLSWNLSSLRWPFEHFQQVVKTLHDAYSAQVEQDKRACEMLPSGWQDVLDIIDKDAWTNSHVEIKKKCFKLVDELTDSIKTWQNVEEGPGLRFDELASKIAFYIDNGDLCPTSFREMLHGDAFSKAISNLVDAAEVAHNGLSEEIESAEDSEVSHDRLDKLRLQLQELNLTSLILKRAHKGGDHPQLAQSSHLALTKTQYVQCLAHLRRSWYKPDNSSILIDNSPLLIFIWLHCPYFEIFSFERDLFLKSLPEGSIWEHPLGSVSEEEWRDSRVDSTLRSEINTCLIRDRVAPHEYFDSSRPRPHYTKRFRDSLLQALTKLHWLTGPQRNRPFVAQSRRTAMAARLAEERMEQELLSGKK